MEGVAASNALLMPATFTLAKIRVFEDGLHVKQFKIEQVENFHSHERVRRIKDQEEAR